MNSGHPGSVGITSVVLSARMGQGAGGSIIQSGGVALEGENYMEEQDNDKIEEADLAKLKAVGQADKKPQDGKQND